MKAYKFWIVVIFAFIPFTRLYSQEIYGKVYTEDKNRLEGATIQLFDPQLKLLKVTSANRDGEYHFSNLTIGKYLLKVNFIGYLESQKVIDLVGEKKMVDSILLTALVKRLQAVDITEKKNLITVYDDKLVLNVEGTILSKGNSIIDLLRKSPGVSIDLSNNIQLNGKGAATILLDDKATNLSSNDLITLLSGMQSESVQSIELISNPSSKYDAAGSSGIINIVTKKKRADGYSLSETVSMTIASHLTEGASLNYLQKKNKLSTYSNFSFTHSITQFDFLADRSIPDDKIDYKLNAFLRPVSFNYFYRGGTDYQLTKKLVIGALVTANFYNGSSDYKGETIIDSIKTSTAGFTNTGISNASRSGGLSFNLYSEYKIDTAGQVLTINLDNSGYHSSSYGNITNAGNVSDINDFIRNSSDNHININTVKVDYVLPANKWLKIEAGAKESFVKTNNSINYENLLGDVYINDASKTNRFYLNENVSALYGTLSAKFSEKFSGKVGLRMENTHNETRSIEADIATENNYLNLFPTLYLTEGLSADNSLNVSYGRRIERPSYQNLNPFIYYINAYSYYSGNPFLKPQYSNNYTLSFSHKQKYFLSLNYMAVSGPIISMPYLTAENIEITKPVNLDRNNLYYTNLSFPVSIAKWWSVYNYINLYYGKYKSHYLSGEFEVSKPTAYVYQSQNFTFSKNTSLEVLMTYDAAQYSGFDLIKQRFQFNLSVQKSFLKDNSASLKLAINDAFKGAANKSSHNYQNLVGNSYGYYDTRSLKITFSYNINRLTGNVNDSRSAGNQEEQGRIK